jgi:hypothetical protein
LGEAPDRSRAMRTTSSTTSLTEPTASGAKHVAGYN